MMDATASSEDQLGKYLIQGGAKRFTVVSTSNAEFILVL